MKTTLKSILEAQAKISSNNPDATAAFERYLEDLRSKGAGKGLSIGDLAPDFALKDATGNMITLAEELKKGPIILIFYRGEWCPFCNLQLKAYERIMKDIKLAGAQLIAISPQTPDHSLSQKEKQGLSYIVLSDLQNKVAEMYNLKYTLPQFMHDKLNTLSKINGDDSFELPVPATYVINQNRIIVAGISNINHRTRMEPSEALDIIKSL
ncbi:MULTISPECIES: peroxiredoxin-like family protein [unclassified Paenibacillus]|uniref:peroxiredoxin-like family protein n=1 Tax=unclassified Paenibacillus TaxID=185978 RepID=UPI0010F131BC|nr:MULTISPECIES: peroxiredoxin-like family protein [unclassified Paenibacillus]NIK66956.1 peroxiredoxin [Paenibacillus sp. BK720]TCN01005.1 peroxiredoxin [Paenibacillus sp. BK033]